MCFVVAVLVSARLFGSLSLAPSCQPGLCFSVVAPAGRVSSSPAQFAALICRELGNPSGACSNGAGNRSCATFSAWTGDRFCRRDPVACGSLLGLGLRRRGGGWTVPCCRPIPRFCPDSPAPHLLCVTPGSQGRTCRGPRNLSPPADCVNSGG